MKNTRYYKIAILGAILPILLVAFTMYAGASILNTSPPMVQTGSLTVYILPYPTKVNIDAGEIHESLVAIVGQEFTDKSNPGASKLGQYDNEGKTLSSSDKIKFVIHPDVKKNDGKTLTADDISENMLFGNGVTAGGILLKDDSTVDATILVADQHYDSLLESKMSQMKTKLSG